MPSAAATLVSLNVGRAETRHDAKPWRSAIWKRPSLLPLDLNVMGLASDQQANRRVHGGPEKAVCVYSIDHAPWWRETLGTPDWGVGAVGENFTVEGLTERGVCIGDVYDVGAARVQVSQPRSPCRTLARRWGRLDLPKLVVQSGRTGWYLRALRSGQVEAGERLTLIERPHPEWTIDRVNRISYGLDPDDLERQRAELAAVPALSPDWRDGLLGR